MENQAHNAEVAAYIKDYLNNKNFAQFAVLLTGKWGSGKTHFILDLKKQYDALSSHEKLNENKEFNWIYVSLNGIDTVEEIEKRIFTAAHTWLNNTAVKLGKSFLGSIVASPQIYGVGFDTKKFAQDLKKLLPRVKNAAFIFDDIERCRLPLSNLFGYINNFIEHDKLKVILVADEDKLKEYYAKEIAAPQQDRSFSTYEQVKEKLVGQTLEIKPDVEGALDAFIEDITDTRTKEIISKNKNTIIEIFNNSQTTNFRSLKKALFSFQRLQRAIENIDKGNQKDTDIIDAQLGDLLFRVIFLTLEYLAGHIFYPSNIRFEKHKNLYNEQEISQNISKNSKPSLFENTNNKKLNSQNIQFIYWSYFRSSYAKLGLFRTPIPYSKIGAFIETGTLPAEDDIGWGLRDDYRYREGLKQLAKQTDEEREKENEDNGSHWLCLLDWQIMDPDSLEEYVPKVMKALMSFKVIQSHSIGRYCANIWNSAATYQIWL